MNGYVNYGCRCDECRKARSDSMREYRERRCAQPAYRKPFMSAGSVGIDAGQLRRVIADDGRSIAEIEREAGLCGSGIHAVLSRGRASLATYDAICSALRINGYEIEELT